LIESLHKLSIFHVYKKYRFPVEKILLLNQGG
jgi:hypothetical protein